MNWERLRTFSEIIRRGSVSAASQHLKLSHATITRRIKLLENEIGDALFAKTQTGYAPTPLAQRLYAHTQTMDDAAHEMRRTLSELTDASSAVRISAGNWISFYLARHADKFLEQSRISAIELDNAYSYVSLPGNEADIAIRASRPEKGRFVCRRQSAPPFLVFADKRFLEKFPEARKPEAWPDMIWAGLNSNRPNVGSSAWLVDEIGRVADIRCTQAINVLDCVAGGSALGLLPAFVKQYAPSLKALSKPITLGAGDLWIVVHEDTYKREPVKAALSTINAILKNMKS